VLGTVGGTRDPSHGRGRPTASRVFTPSCASVSGSPAVANGSPS
jgi:hypothetical protein